MVSADDLETNTRFAKEHEADYPIMADTEKTVANAYGVLSPAGLARRWTFYIGSDGKIILIDKAVRAANAGEDLATKLAELADKKLVKRK